MKYIRVKWKHSFECEPVYLYSELDDNSWELRKVEVYADGRYDFAGEGESMGDARLSTEPIPSLEEISLDPQFESAEITKAEFERIWKLARE